MSTNMLFRGLSNGRVQPCFKSSLTLGLPLLPGSWRASEKPTVCEQLVVVQSSGESLQEVRHNRSVARCCHQDSRRYGRAGENGRRSKDNYVRTAVSAAGELAPFIFPGLNSAPLLPHARLLDRVCKFVLDWCSCLDG